MNSAEAERRQNLLQCLEPYRGGVALYREGSRFCLVRVDDFAAGDDELAARVSLVPTAGLCNDWPDAWSVQARWDRLTSADDLFVSAYIGLMMYFERGLVEAIARWSESVSCEVYNHARFEQIVEWIQKYRTMELSRQLSSELTLYHDGRVIGIVTDSVPADYPDVHARFAPADMETVVHRSLDDYGHWWIETWGNDSPKPAPTEHLSGKWWLQSSQGQRFDCRIPVVDFHERSIVWRYRSAPHDVPCD